MAYLVLVSITVFYFCNMHMEKPVSLNSIHDLEDSFSDKSL